MTEINELVKQNFAINLKHLMVQNNKTDIILAHDLIIPRQSIKLWLSGSCFPKCNTLSLLAQYFNVQVFELLQEHNAETKVTTPILQEIINQIPLLTKEELNILLNILRFSI